jgi:catechol 2,3-dioxygenase-like lactoylglutathione lyase family enzyme
LVRARVGRSLLVAHGRIVDLGGDLCALEDYPPAVRGSVSVLEATPGGLAAAIGGSAPFDTVVSMGRLAFEADPDTAIGAIAAGLAPDGRLVFVEPDPGPGTVGRGTSRLWSLAGVEVGTDLTRRLWAGGLSVLRVRRFSIPTLVLPLRNWVWGTARPAREVAGDSRGDDVR